MMTFLCILVFLAIGAIAGYAIARAYEAPSLLACVLTGIAGSLLLPWLMSLMGLGAGFAAFSIWGVIFGVLGACLLPLLYCWLQKRSAAKASQHQ